MKRLIILFFLLFLSSCAIVDEFFSVGLEPESDEKTVEYADVNLDITSPCDVRRTGV